MSLIYSRTRAPVAEVADLAVDVVVGADGEDGDVEVALAVSARQALLVIDLVVDVDLLGLK